MSPTPVISQTGDEDFHWAIDLPENYPVASEAGLGWAPIDGSTTLVEDARAVLNGDANYLLGHGEPLADIEGPYSMDQDILNAVTLHVVYIPVVVQVSGPNMIPHGAPSQFQPEVPVAPTHPASNNQFQHAAVTPPLQCPYGCTGMFRRRVEYRRHMKKHTGPFFPCTHPDCSKMFYRQDKLRDHLAKGH
ncbi:hypothetical protein GT037_010693 [Alternaria burnsii]|uniref:C2H2-type domain-containing protein n=1 Tax=Alternaria burnsii TaxID=1187904 RepID=A0A8H7E945_9PLEO|nr:uncharacterized protein GT037_010693 [Alternaria burnsii]KAF7671132.1 hypothetical protein GT037_010693 [Alternaria burnsii]